MNLSELERLAVNMNSEYDRDRVEAWEYFCDIAPYLVRRVIAAEKLEEAATKFMAAYHSGKNIHGHADNIDNVLKNINSDRECF